MVAARYSLYLSCWVNNSPFPHVEVMLTLHPTMLPHYTVAWSQLLTLANSRKKLLP